MIKTKIYMRFSEIFFDVNPFVDCTPKGKQIEVFVAHSSLTQPHTTSLYPHPKNKGVKLKMVVC